MINELLLENFKLFGKETHLAGLKSMNLLTGVNGRGKSSALQPLLLFKQTLLRSRSSRQIFLSGSFVDLGNASDVKHVDASVTRPIRIGFTENEETYVYTFGIADENKLPDWAKQKLQNMAGQNSGTQNTQGISM